MQSFETKKIFFDLYNNFKELGGELHEPLIDSRQ